MTEAIRSWPDSLFYFSTTGTANALEQFTKLQRAAKLLRALSDAATVDSNGDVLQDVLVALSLGSLSQRHKLRVRYDSTNDRLSFQRNTGTDAAKTYVELAYIDSSGNLTVSGSISTDALTTTAGGVTLGGTLDVNDFYVKNLGKIKGQTRTDDLWVHRTSRFDGASTFNGSATFRGVTQFYVESIENLSRGWVHLKTKTASSSSSVDFIGLSVYSKYVVELEGVRPATDAVSMLMRVSTNNGSSYDSAGNYSTVGTLETNFPAAGAIATSGATSWNVSGDGSTTIDAGSAQSALSGTLFVNSRGSATLQARIRSEVEYLESNGVFLTRATISGGRTPDATINAIRFLMSSGNIASGTFRLYGQKVNP